MDKVVIWTQAYNAEKTLARAIESILNQTYKNFEYHILDNGSTDNTYSIIKEYAKHDERIVVHHADKNNINTGYSYAVIYQTSAKWLCWLDADDEYSSEFLDTMVSFANKNKLSIALCGYDQIDGITGEILFSKFSKKEVIVDNNHAEEFISYRPYTITIWGALISIKLLTQNAYFMPKLPGGGKYKNYDESTAFLNLFKEAKRFGVYPSAMYKYYQYPSSLSRNMELDYFEGYVQHYNSLRKYLKSFGKISSFNEDYLCAIYLSIIEERIRVVYQSDLELKKKLIYIRKIFEKNITKRVFLKKADPQFRNLVARKKMLNSIREWILEQEITKEEKKEAKKILVLLRNLLILNKVTT